MPIRRWRRTLGLFWLLVVSVGAHSAAFANVTYTYTGKPYTNFFGGFSCPSVCAISATVVFASPLPPNLGTPDYVNGGQGDVYVTPVAFSITDGLGTITEATQQGSGFRFVTDSSGNIIEWLIYAGYLRGGFAYTIQSRGEGSHATNDLTETYASGAADNNNSPGTWSSLAAPTNLKATQIGNTGTQILLTWNYGNDPIDGFKIERKTPTGAWSELPKRSPTDRFYVDAGATIVDPTAPLVPYATYTYRIRAFKGSDQSANSNEGTCFQLALTLVGSKIFAGFTPDRNTTLSQIAQAPGLGYDHFNWINRVEHDPVADLGLILDINKKPVTVPYDDPPPGGYYLPNCRTGAYSAQPFDLLPYYWEEVLGIAPGYYIFDAFPGGDQRLSSKAVFADQPESCQLGVGQYLGFLTTLVGVQTSVPAASNVADFTVLAAFLWYSNFTSISGGVFRSNIDPTTPPGTGGIFNAQIVNVNDLPQSVRIDLVRAGAKGVSTSPKVDRDASMTSAFVSGLQGTNGWYTGPVAMTLIATDIDGPSDITFTYYRIDGGPWNTFTGPFTISSDGTHTINFDSIDRAGNSEATKSLVLKIDKTPTVISGMPAAGCTLWPPNQKLVTVGTITASDALSGLAPGSFKITGTSNEPASDSKSPDIVITPNATGGFVVQLRADRLGSGKGRIYTLNATANDLAGNTATVTAACTVPHDQAKK